MTEYWVSQSKFYCKYCNVWIADNKPSRQHHEKGFKHIQSLQMFQKEKREKSLHGARSEYELKQTLADIEKAAKEAIREDRLKNDGVFYSNAPTTNSRSNPQGQSDFRTVVPRSGLGNSDDSDEARTGVYEVRGQFYLEGTMHSDKLRQGVQFEIFDEEEDDWLPAKLELRKEVAVPHTSLTIAGFDVSYPRKLSDGSMSRVFEESVKADRLRLLADKDGNPLYTAASTSSTIGSERETETQIESAASSQRAIIDEATGMSAWQTVSVDVIDDKEERRKVKAEEKKRRIEEELQKKAEHIAAIRSSLVAQELDFDDNFSTNKVFDPFSSSSSSSHDDAQEKKNTYKGIDLGLNTDIRNPHDIEPLANKGEVVAFKKRKRPGVGNNNSGVI